eukprot:6683514-Pyramimonas_sp.AAC.1
MGRRGLAVIRVGRTSAGPGSPRTWRQFRRSQAPQETPRSGGAPRMTYLRWASKSQRKWRHARRSQAPPRDNEVSW